MLNWAYALLESGSTASALQLYGDVVKQLPEDGRARAGLANALARAGRVAAAREESYRAEQLDSRFAAAMQELREGLKTGNQ